MVKPKIALITGANSGIGFGIAGLLAARHSEHTPFIIVLGCRSNARAEAARNALLDEYFPDKRQEGLQVIQILLVDVGSVKSVLSACKQFKERFDQLDLLFCNAGIMNVTGLNIKNAIWMLLTDPMRLSRTGGGGEVLTQKKDAKSVDGLGETFHVNVFGHYIILRELESLLDAAPKSRVIWVSSLTAVSEFLNPDDLQALTNNSAYESSKRLMDVLSMQLSRQWVGKSRYSFMTDPGVTMTGIVGDLLPQWALTCAYYTMRLLGTGATPSSGDGAYSAVHVALDEHIEDLKPTIKYGSWTSPFGHTSIAERKVESVLMREEGVLSALEKLYMERSGTLRVTETTSMPRKNQAALPSTSGGHVKSLPYELQSLQWIEEEWVLNRQNQYCYCGSERHGTMIRCQLCRQLFHEECTNVSPVPFLHGDVFFTFTCSVCGAGQQTYTRLPMSWASTIHLVLFHLGQEHPESEDFRWKEDICRMIDELWTTLWPDKPRPATWPNTVASALSTHKKLFKSGFEQHEQQGWWGLVHHVPPKLSRKPEESTLPVVVFFSPDDDSFISYNGIPSAEVHVTLPSSSGRPKRERETPTRLKDGVSTPTIAPGKKRKRAVNEDIDNMKSIKPEMKIVKIEEASRAGSSEISEAMPALSPSVEGERTGGTSSKKTQFTEPIIRKGILPSVVVNKPQPSKPELELAKAEVARACAESETQRMDDEFLSVKEESELLSQLSGKSVAENRMRRKLLLRQFNRARRLPIFDLDASVLSTIPSVTRLPITRNHQNYSKAQIHHPPYAETFAATLHGVPFLSHCLTNPESRSSPYTGRVLRPFIWRDYNSQPPALLLLEEIRHLYKTNSDEEEVISIDYSHFQFFHLDQVNDLLWRVFWPGIDVAEHLMYPDYSIVVMYRRLVVGCAFMTPEGYITYIAVRPGWGGQGLARFMLYYLIQILPSRDITLHVSANNPAMILYQQFGFKPEEFVVNFFDKYLPPESRDCKNAFLVRLRR
ncbi:hypothetical protein SmJEL517_g01863 [Synchytrium microbalum]|uniref:N-acetyltransferase domain-containing protein n=1 Tax=Synchytrium microbalum TaxID=1806994 RepID=A0A507C954_9FUNG|nr:uncharacterized protein SmJEL517_g01863 [Synchytrium microbalum]TPX35699.1 hypothetical protein SmJEL517_g01863 [Synchytrium microbalum]